MDVREKLVELLSEKCMETCKQRKGYVCSVEECKHSKEKCCGFYADHLISNGVTVQEWYSAGNPPKEDGTYLVQTNTGTITTARFYAFKSFPATKCRPAYRRSTSWQSNRNVVKWTYLPQPPKGE